VIVTYGGYGFTIATNIYDYTRIHYTDHTIWDANGQGNKILGGYIEQASSANYEKEVGDSIKIINNSENDVYITIIYYAGSAYDVVGRNIPISIYSSEKVKLNNMNLRMSSEKDDALLRPHSFDDTEVGSYRLTERYKLPAGSITNISTDFSPLHLFSLDVNSSL